MSFLAQPLFLLDCGGGISECNLTLITVALPTLAELNLQTFNNKRFFAVGPEC